MKKIFVFITLTITGLATTIAFANAQINTNLLNKMTGDTSLLSNTVNGKNFVDADIYIGGIIGMILSFAGVIFLVLTIIAGYMWITAQGAEDKITKAKQLLTNGVVGALVCFGSFIIINSIISPLYEKFYSPTQISSAGNGGQQTQIPCSVNEQCADQITRRMCINGNCLECEDNDQGNESSVCINLYGSQDKTSCDAQNHVCVPNPSMGCTSLSQNTCLSQNNCRWAHGNSFYSGHCVNKEDYSCSTQCQGNKPFCLLETNPSICVECRDDSDCANNLLDKKCSVSTGNYICVPF